MAIQHMDNFSIYGTDKTLLLDGIYAEAGNGGDQGSVSLVADPDGISSGYVFSINGGYGGGGAYTLLRYVLSSNQTTCGVATRLWMPNLPPDTERKICPIQWRDVSNNPLWSITVDTTGRLQLRTGNFDGTILETTTSPVVTAAGWWHIEAKLLVNASGNIEVRVEGQTVIDHNLDSGSTAVSQVAVCNDPTSASASTTFYIKDFVVWDGSGSHNTSFLGSVIVTNLAVDSDVALNWTPSTGTTGYGILDNVPPVDSEYIAAPYPAPSAYQGSLTALPNNITSVKAVMTFVRAAKTDGGDGSLQTSVISNSATANGADRPITVAMTYWRDVFEVDPDTSAAWLPAAVDLADIKLNRTV